jgi:hypothetical protein
LLSSYFNSQFESRKEQNHQLPRFIFYLGSNRKESPRNLANRWSAHSESQSTLLFCGLSCVSRISDVYRALPAWDFGSVLPLTCGREDKGAPDEGRPEGEVERQVNSIANALGVRPAERIPERCADSSAPCHSAIAHSMLWRMMKGVFMFRIHCRVL